jgi:hypothetical protein
MQDWLTDLNVGIEHLKFSIMEQSHMVHYVDPLVNIHSLIICEGFEVDILVMKGHCIVACDLLVIELECKFLDHELMMNVIGVIYPQYWLQLNCESTFKLI